MQCGLLLIIKIEKLGESEIRKFKIKNLLFK